MHISVIWFWSFIQVFNYNTYLLRYFLALIYCSYLKYFIEQNRQSENIEEEHIISSTEVFLISLELMNQIFSFYFVIFM